MSTEKLVKTLPTLQNQLDALLDFECSTADLNNGVINSAFMLLFRDLIRLFACYNDGIINLLGKYTYYMSLNILTFYVKYSSWYFFSQKNTLTWIKNLQEMLLIYIRNSSFAWIELLISLRLQRYVLFYQFLWIFKKIFLWLDLFNVH